MTVSGQVPEQAHAQLAKATAGFFENGTLPMWIYDLSTLAFLAVNGAAAECYGYSHEEFRAMTARQLHLRAERTASLDEVLSSPFSPQLERTWRHVRKDGTILYADVTCLPVSFAGHKACLVIAVDVSEGKRAELIYRMLMDTIPSSVLLLDVNLCVVLANRNFLEKSRLTTEVTAGKRLAEVFPEAILAGMGLEQQIRNVFRSSHATQGQRLTYRAPGVPIRVYYYSIVPVNWTGI